MSKYGRREYIFPASIISLPHVPYLIFTEIYKESMKDSTKLLCSRWLVIYLDFFCSRDPRLNTIQYFNNKFMLS